MAILRQRSLDQLKKVMKAIGDDVGTKSSKGESSLPNAYWLDNPITSNRKIDTYEQFIKKDNKLQTKAFQSKLVNKPLVNKQLED